MRYIIHTETNFNNKTKGSYASKILRLLDSVMLDSEITKNVSMLDRLENIDNLTALFKEHYDPNKEHPLLKKEIGSQAYKEVITYLTSNNKEDLVESNTAVSALIIFETIKRLKKYPYMFLLKLIVSANYKEALLISKTDTYVNCELDYCLDLLYQCNDLSNLKAIDTYTKGLISDIIIAIYRSPKLVADIADDFIHFNYRKLIDTDEISKHLLNYKQQVALDLESGKESNRVLEYKNALLYKEYSLAYKKYIDVRIVKTI